MKTQTPTNTTTITGTERRSPIRFALASTAIAAISLLGAAPQARSQVLTSFENPANGTYTNGATVIGKTDTSTGGAWSNFSGNSADMYSSNAHPLAGVLSVRLQDADALGSLATGAHLQVPNASSLLTSPFTFSLSMAINSVSAGTGSQVQIYFGQQLVGDGNHWLRAVYNDGNLQIVTGNGSIDSAVNVGAYTTYSPLGSYVTFNLTIDPSTHKYTSATISGTLSSADVTSTVLASNGGTIPWTSSAGNPGTTLGLIIGSNDTAVVDFDVLSVVPEPSTAALLGLAALALGYTIRRRLA